MRLKCDNRILTKDQPKSLLTTGASAGATTLTVASNTAFSNGDYILLGRIGEEKAEISRINGAITAGTSLTVTTLIYTHDIDTPVVKIDYNQVQFYRGTTTVATSSSSLAGAQNIDPTEVWSYYEDVVNTTGYGFIRFYNSATATYSVYSSPISYAEKTGYTDKALRMIRKKVRRLIKQMDPQNSDFTDDEIDEEINLAQKEVAHDRMWSFYEKTKSFSSVANQYEYSLATDVFALFDSMFDTQPLVVTDRHRMNRLRWDSDVTGDPTHICMWGRRVAVIYPYKTTAADTTTLTGAHNATVTTLTVASTSSFPTQGRILIGSEVISYTGKTATTFTGCTRGDEETTAASYSGGETITERDFIYHFQEEPSDMIDEHDETAITEPSVIAYKAAAELTEGTLHDRNLAKFDKAMTQLRSVDEPKIKRSFGQVRDINEVSSEYGESLNPNDHPQNLTGV